MLFWVGWGSRVGCFVGLLELINACFSGRNMTIVMRFVDLSEIRNEIARASQLIQRKPDSHNSMDSQI